MSKPKVSQPQNVPIHQRWSTFEFPIIKQNPQEKKAWNIKEWESFGVGLWVLAGVENTCVENLVSYGKKN